MTASVSGRQWQFREALPRDIMAIVQRHDMPEAVARILASRGLALESIAGFLAPKLRDSMPDPLTLKDMDKAIACLIAAIETGKRIAIFGDYDVDGATSTALFKRYLAFLGVEARVYIPDRMREGYGPNAQAFKALRDEGIELVITVDCGTMAHDVLEQAAHDGLQVIVVDHHQTGQDLPVATAIVNPRRPDDESGLGDLAAVGVCFMVLVALQRALRQAGRFADKDAPDLLALLDLVALGTVCDVVPLHGLNRAFVAQGLLVMSRGENIGISALAKIAHSKRPYDAYALGFQLGPRINAGGRVGASDLGARLLSTADGDEAIGIAARLDDYNAERRALTDKVLAEAEAMAQADIDKRNATPPVLLLASQDWHAGVIGIVAGRLKDAYHRPCIIVALDADGAGKGSARSVAGVDIGRVIAGAVSRGVIAGGGGHAMAAGATLASGELDAFRGYLEETLGAMAFAEAQTLALDAPINVGGAHRGLYDSLARIGPFGAGNPEPCFAIESARVVKADLVRGDHVRCIFSGESGGRLKGIAFASVPAEVRQFLLTHPQSAHIAGWLRADDWQGREDVQLVIRDAAKL